jgi:cardiolipin synthase
MSSAAVLNLPNLITLLRIVVIPVFLILLTDGRYRDALILFVLAAATDSLDGAIAQLTHTRTTFGTYIDPLADKLLLMGSFVVLAFLGFVPRWLAILVISRDVTILIGFVVLFFMTRRFIAVQPSLIGKASTFLQLLTVTLTLLSLHNPDWHLPLIRHSVILLAGGATTVSGFQYLYRALLWLSEQEENPEVSLPGAGKVDGEKEERRKYSVRGR